MEIYRVCWTTYGQSYVKANSPAKAEEIAQKKFDVKGIPDVTITHNDWEMVDEAEKVSTWEIDRNPWIVKFSEEETEVAKVLTKPFKITSVSRADIVQMLTDKGMDKDEATKKALSFSDLEMMEIADKMTEAYVENSFWGDLEIISEDTIDQRGEEDEDA
jgi:hypothetical protein